MAHGPGLYEQLRDLTGKLDARPDSELLERFLATGDGDAFATLLGRHGALVWGVCRRVLVREHDAEDAFQATFLVLARKASSVRRRSSLRCWLYGVALRVASRARNQAERRREVSANDPPATADDPLAAADRAELAAVLDREIRRLPERYRVALILCHLAGRTIDEAARELGCPKGTVATRLARARERLRRRLLQRGLGPCAALPAVMADAALPDRLVLCTRTNVSLFLSGRLAAGTALNLAEGVLTSMFFDKCKAAMVILLTTAAIAGMAVGARSVLARTPPAPPLLAGEAPPPGKKAEAKQDREALTARIKELLAKRREAAAARYRALSEQFKAGRGSFEALIESCDSLLRSELGTPLSAGKDAIAVRQAHLDRLKAIQEIVNQRNSAHRLDIEPVKHMEFCVLDAELNLLLEKAQFE